MGSNNTTTMFSADDIKDVEEDDNVFIRKLMERQQIQIVAAQQVQKNIMMKNRTKLVHQQAYKQMLVY
jgi:hypothetical protein